MQTCHRCLTVKFAEMWGHKTEELVRSGMSSYKATELALEEIVNVLTEEASEYLIQQEFEFAPQIAYGLEATPVQ